MPREDNYLYNAKRRQLLALCQRMTTLTLTILLSELREKFVHFSRINHDVIRNPNSSSELIAINVRIFLNNLLSA